MPILKEYKNSPSKVTLFGSLVTLQIPSCCYTGCMEQLHANMENTNQPLLLINEIGADVFQAAENTKGHIEIELS